MTDKLLLATNIDDMPTLYSRLESFFEITYKPNLQINDCAKIERDINVVFTNPNNSSIYFGEEFFSHFPSIETIVTASTGTIHIDKACCKARNIEIISITESLPVLERITSTAELAFLLTLSAIRHYDHARASVDECLWDYSPFIGRQLNEMTVGVVGFGRLGKMYARFASAFGATVICCDPFKEEEITAAGFACQDLNEIFKKSDIVSLHVHATVENQNLINEEVLNNIVRPCVLVNTSRGEIVDEVVLLRFLKNNPNVRYYSDVISGEHAGVAESPLRRSSLYGKQVFLTPHCGGMTYDARSIAYNHAADLLLDHF